MQVLCLCVTVYVRSLAKQDGTLLNDRLHPIRVSAVAAVGRRGTLVGMRRRAERRERSQGDVTVTLSAKKKGR